MPRPLRLQVPGGIYHVMSHGIGSQWIFEDDIDRRLFQAKLRSMTERLNVLCHDYCLLYTHYHLLLETPEANLSRAMQFLNGTYAQGFNRRHGRKGHLFHARFHAKLVEDGAYFMVASRYIALNPVGADTGIEHPQQWPWSSYRAHAGLEAAPAYLTEERLLDHFDATDYGSARKAYKRFVLDGLSKPEPLGDGPILGSPEFIAKFGDAPEASAPSNDISRRERMAARPTLEEVFRGCSDRVDRDRRIRMAHVGHGYKLTAIAHHLGMHRATVSRAIRKMYHSGV